MPRPAAPLTSKFFWDENSSKKLRNLGKQGILLPKQVDQMIRFGKKRLAEKEYSSFTELMEGIVSGAKKSRVHVSIEEKEILAYATLKNSSTEGGESKEFNRVVRSDRFNWLET